MSLRNRAAHARLRSTTRRRGRRSPSPRFASGSFATSSVIRRPSALRERCRRYNPAHPRLLDRVAGDFLRLLTQLGDPRTIQFPCLRHTERENGPASRRRCASCSLSAASPRRTRPAPRFARRLHRAAVEYCCVRRCAPAIGDTQDGSQIVHHLFVSTGSDQAPGMPMTNLSRHRIARRIGEEVTRIRASHEAGRSALLASAATAGPVADGSGIRCMENPDFSTPFLPHRCQFVPRSLSSHSYVRPEDMSLP